MRKNDYNSNISCFSFNDASPCLGDCEQYFKQICIRDNKIIISLISFLEFYDVLSLKNTCKSIHKKIDKKVVKNYVRIGGLTINTRREFWMSNIDYKGMERIIRKEINDVSEFENLYNKILIKSDLEKLNNDRKFFKVSEEISRDIDRTFHFGKFKTSEGQQEIGRVLTAIAYVRPEIGYCQGMNFVAGALIYFIGEEELVFWIFLALLDERELNSLYFKVILFFF